MIKNTQAKLLVLFTIILVSNFWAAEHSSFAIDAPPVVLDEISFDIQLQPAAYYYTEFDLRYLPYRIVDAETDEILTSGVKVIDSRKPQPVVIKSFSISGYGLRNMSIELGSYTQRMQIRVLPPILSILPPLIAIILALITRQVIIALFFGIWLGVTFIYDYNPFTGFLHTLDTYIVNALGKPDHVAILLFSLVLGGMVGVIIRSGGMQGIVDHISRYAKNPRRGQLATWALGILIFFDDYANTLIVGNTMRALTDKLKISREKLSYLVDSTAAPVANIAIISTWIGYEISLINQSFTSLGITDNAYITFLRTIPYNFYPIYALVFGFFIAFLLRDFGSMYKAEKRTRQTGEVMRSDAMPLADLTDTEIEVDNSVPRRWYNALIPVGVVIFAVIAGLFYTGFQSLAEKGIILENEGFVRRISLVVGESDSFSVLMWASFTGSISAMVLAVTQRILTLQQSIEAWVKGIRSMMMAAIILVSAWTIGNICQELFTADYVIHLTRSFLTPYWLPLITFLTAAIVSFSTGTSWGTMAILMPIAIPLAVKFPLAQAIDPSHATTLMLSTTAAVLAGATFGDHCSPISDTTIMSSMASGADHIDHVRTQLPYALIVGLVACVFGYIPVGLGWSGWGIVPAGIIILILIVRFAGSKTAY